MAILTVEPRLIIGAKCVFQPSQNASESTPQVEAARILPFIHVLLQFIGLFIFN